jgi:hypothetical protein
MDKKPLTKINEIAITKDNIEDTKIVSFLPSI